LVSGVTLAFDDQYASMNAAISKNSMTPQTSNTLLRAARRSASPRVRRPGAISAQPSLSPAAPARAMPVSSNAPWPITNDQMV